MITETVDAKLTLAINVILLISGLELDIALRTGLCRRVQTFTWLPAWSVKQKLWSALKTCRFEIATGWESQKPYGVKAFFGAYGKYSIVLG